MNRTLFTRAFRIGIALKGVSGALEVGAGVAVWFLNEGALAAVLEPAAPQHLRWVVVRGISAVHQSRIVASCYLIAHGLVKAILVVALRKNRLWAYPVTISFFAMFCAYQLERYATTHSGAMIALTALDLILIWLTWREYRLRRSPLPL